MLLRRLLQKQNFRSSAVLTLLCGAFAVTGCLTPDFQFDPDPGAGMGGDGSMVAHCLNRKQDADESDIDCGGLDCDKCGLEASCKRNSDCENGSCIDGTCLDTACKDDKQNGDETDIDCGGSCSPCADEKSCEVAQDCESAVCKSDVCQVPTCSDRVKNGEETDEDCGGSCAPCDIGQGCAMDDDCTPLNASNAASECVGDVCTVVCAEESGRECDGDLMNGCEDISTDLTNCGACSVTCGGDQAGVASVACTNSACEVTCTDANTCPDDSNPERPCTGVLDSPQHCGGCGNACAASSPFCISAVCEGGNSSNQKHLTQGSDRVLRLTHTLKLPAASGRLVVAGVTVVADNAEQGTPKSVKFGTVDMKLAHGFVQSNGGGAVGAHLYYLSEADLVGANLGAGSHELTVTSADGGNQVLLSQITEFGGMSAGAPIGKIAGSGAETCAGTEPITTISGGVTNGSRVYAVTSARTGGVPGAPATSPSGLTTLDLELSGHRGYFGYSAPGTLASLEWLIDQCDRHASILVELVPQ